MEPKIVCCDLCGARVVEFGGSISIAAGPQNFLTLDLCTECADRAYRWHSSCVGHVANHLSILMEEVQNELQRRVKEGREGKKAEEA